MNFFKYGKYILYSELTMFGINIINMNVYPNLYEIKTNEKTNEKIDVINKINKDPYNTITMAYFEELAFRYPVLLTVLYSQYNKFAPIAGLWSTIGFGACHFNNYSFYKDNFKYPLEMNTFQVLNTSILGFGYYKTVIKFGFTGFIITNIHHVCHNLYMLHVIQKN